MENEVALRALFLLLRGRGQYGRQSQTNKRSKCADVPSALPAVENDVTEVFLENEVALRALFASFAGVDSVNVGFTGKAAWGAAPAEAAAGLSAAEFKTLSAKHDLMPNM